jgi:uncharacterized protein (DUF697 family)
MTATGSPGTSDESLIRIAHAERLARARVLVKNYTLGSAALALLPLPLVDQVALMALEIKMVHDLAKHYDVPFKSTVVRSLISALLSGLTSGLLVKALQSLARAVPVLGTLGGGGGIAVSSASVTYAVGSVFIKHFEANGTLLTVDSEWLKRMFHQELNQDQPGEAEADAAAAPAEVVVAVVS